MPPPDPATPSQDGRPAARAADGEAPEEASPRQAASEELRRLYFKHRERLQRGEPAELSEREADRLRVDELYPTLGAGGDKVLDARTLGVLIDSHVQTQQQALMSLVTPAERLAMLAVIVRRNGFPVASVPHVGTLALSPLLGQQRVEVEPGTVVLDADHPEAQAQSATAQPGLPAASEGVVQRRRVEPGQLESAKQALLERLEQGLTAQEVAALTVDEAQMLSILATGRGLRLEVRAEGGLIAVPRALAEEGQTLEHPDTSEDSTEHERQHDEHAAREFDLELPTPRAMCLSYAPALPSSEDAYAESAGSQATKKKKPTKRAAKKKTTKAARRRGGAIRQEANPAEPGEPEESEDAQ